MGHWIQWMDENKVLLIGIILISGTAYLTSSPVKRWEWLDFIPGIRGRRMRKERMQYVLDDAAENFVDFIIERVKDDKWSRLEGNEIYRRLKICFPVRNLFPNPHLLKEAIQKRRESGIHAPVPLPDGQPKRKLKHAFDKPKRVVL